MLQGATDDEHFTKASAKQSRKGRGPGARPRANRDKKNDNATEDMEVDKQDSGKDVDSDEEDGDGMRREEEELERTRLEEANLLLLPLMKSIYSNADRLNRRQAAAVVGHIAHSSPEASALAKCFVSKLREFNPIRCMEVQMATLRVFYDKWVVSASNEESTMERVDTVSSTAEEEERRAAAEVTGMSRWVPLAQRLSLSLGVGPVKAKAGIGGEERRELQEAYLRFMKEGVRFSLDRAEAPERFLFLECLPFYASKLTQGQKKALVGYFDEQVQSLYTDTLEEGREFAGAWDEGEGFPIRWKAFFNFRNLLSPGKDALSLLTPPAPPSSPSASASASEAGTIVMAATPRRGGGGTSHDSGMGGGGSGSRALSGRRARLSSGSKRAFRRVSHMSSASDLFPVSEED
ncbi:unnamed protein product, partial [Choristocarpus tenellus]